MTVFVALLLTVLAFVFITYPLLRQRLRSVDAVDDEQLQELYSRKDTAYSMLKELEFDFESGILSKEDYQELETRYKGKAISILRGIDDLGNDIGVGDEIENQVQKLRREKTSQVDEELEKEVLSLRRGKAKGRFCSQCGVECQVGDRFCARCGTPLR
ncbi:MAG: zinc-ribbon domain-containing protein [Chloroflexi bacterium]|nr:zinc-ribbon domain-containing protein [Chloroflexota bacterium]